MIEEKPFPSKPGTWFFQIDAHHGEEDVIDFGCKGLQFLGIFESAVVAVYRAWADNEEFRGVFAADNIAYRRSP